MYTVKLIIFLFFAFPTQLSSFNTASDIAEYHNILEWQKFQDYKHCKRNARMSSIKFFTIEW